MIVAAVVLLAVAAYGDPLADAVTQIRKGNAGDYQAQLDAYEALAAGQFADATGDIKVRVLFLQAQAVYQANAVKQSVDVTIPEAKALLDDALTVQGAGNSRVPCVLYHISLSRLTADFEACVAECDRLGALAWLDVATKADLLRQKAWFQAYGLHDFAAALPTAVAATQLIIDNYPGDAARANAYIQGLAMVEGALRAGVRSHAIPGTAYSDVVPGLVGAFEIRSDKNKVGVNTVSALFNGVSVAAMPEAEYVDLLRNLRRLVRNESNEAATLLGQVASELNKYE